jgi:S1-C subfamily serine protease
VDANGRVVGVLSSGEAENLNFAVPINLACREVRVCKRRGR